MSWSPSVGRQRVFRAFQQFHILLLETGANVTSELEGSSGFSPWNFIKSFNIHLSQQLS